MRRHEEQEKEGETAGQKTAWVKERRKAKQREEK